MPSLSLRFFTPLFTRAQVCIEVEAWSRKEKFGAMSYPVLATEPDERVSEEICTSAAILADNLKAAAIVVYTRRGHMATFLSRRRPNCPILAVTGALPFLCNKC